MQDSGLANMVCQLFAFSDQIKKAVTKLLFMLREKIFVGRNSRRINCTVFDFQTTLNFHSFSTI